jgi:autotransporter-associated beta strand protein
MRRFWSRLLSWFRALRRTRFTSSPSRRVPRADRMPLPLPVPRRKRPRTTRSGRPLHQLAGIEVLEPRQTVATIWFHAGLSTFAADYYDSLTVSSSSDGYVLVNGATVSNGSTTLAAASVDSISIQSGDQWNDINLTGVARSAFSHLAGITVFQSRGTGVVDGTALGEFVVGSDGSTTLNSAGGDATLITMGGTNILNGGDGTKTLTGYGGDYNTLYGGSGTNTLSEYSSGYNTLYGGTGANTLQTFNGGYNVLNAAGDSNTLYGSSGTDILNGAGGTYNVFYGGSGNETLNGGSGTNIFFPSGGTNTFNGGSDTNILYYGGANTTFNPGTAMNVMCGADGDNTFGGGQGSYTLYGSADGTNTLNARSHTNILNDGGGNNVLNSGWGTNTLNGSSGDNTLDGYGGYDVLNGGSGINTLNGGWGNETLNGGSGTNVFHDGGGKNMVSMPQGGALKMANGSLETLHLQQQTGSIVAPLHITGATLDFDLSSSGADRITDSGAATISGINTINITAQGSSLSTGSPYTLISAASGLTGSFVFSNGTPLENLTVGGHAYTLALRNTDTTETVTVGSTDYWVGTTAANTWDTTAANWSATSGGSIHTTFHNGDVVIFDNAAAATSVALPAGVSPSAMIFNTSSNHAYTINGSSSNAIGGAGTWLSVQGGGSVTLVGANTFTGLTTIATGTLKLGDGTTNGAVGGDIVNKGALVFDNPTAQIYFGVISGSGSLSATGDGALTLGGANSYRGPTTVAANSVVKAGAPSAFSANSAYIIGGTLDLNGFDQSIGALSGAGIVTNSAASTTATLTVGNDDANTTFSGTLQDATSVSGVLGLDKVGGGTLTLTAQNTISGDTTIDGGTLEVDNYIMPSAVTINSGATLQGNGGTGPVTVMDDGIYDANVYTVTIADGALQTALGTLTTTGSLALNDRETGTTWGLSALDAIFREIGGSASVQETGQTYSVQAWGNIVNGALAPPAFQYNPNFSCTDGSGMHNIGQTITFNERDGVIGDAGNYNAAFAAVQVAPQQLAILTVTNMAPLTIDLLSILQQVQTPAGFDPTTATAAFTNVRGGDLGDGNPPWIYTPHVTYNGENAWDPLHPFGGGPDDGPDAGASFTVVFTDANGKQAGATVVLRDHHLGYRFRHYGRWIDARTDGHAGIMLVGGGHHPREAYSWFVRQSNYGDIVVIANGAEADPAGDRRIALEFAGLGARSVDVFDFEVDSFGAFNEDSLLVAQNTAGFGDEFLDKLGGAEAVYFAGGNQWPYVELLQTDWQAANIISDSNSLGLMTVGGTSAGTAILGNYVYTAQFTQGPEGDPAAKDLTSQEILANFHTDKFYRNGRDAISNSVLRIDQLEGVLTETHLNDSSKDESSSSDHDIYRLGRFLSFLGATLLDGYSVGRGALNGFVNGIAADAGAALTINKDGLCQVYGGTVYFALTSDYLGLGLSHPQPNDTSIVHLELSYVQLYWYEAGAQFQLADALRGWGSVDPNHRAWFAVHHGDLIMVSGIWPPDFPPTLP